MEKDTNNASTSIEPKLKAPPLPAYPLPVIYTKKEEVESDKTEKLKKLAEKKRQENEDANPREVDEDLMPYNYFRAKRAKVAPGNVKVSETSPILVSAMMPQPAVPVPATETNENAGSSAVEAVSFSSDWSAYDASPSDPVRGAFGYAFPNATSYWNVNDVMTQEYRDQMESIKLSILVELNDYEMEEEKKKLKTLLKMKLARMLWDLKQNHRT